MKKKIIALASVLCAAGTAFSQPTLVAAWDFSQYAFDGVTSIDGATYAPSLASNYSQYDPNELGAQSGHGTFYYDGQFGSSAFDLANEALPTSGVLYGLSLNANPNGLLTTMGSPGAFNVLLFEGQAYANDLSFTITTGGSLVFAVNSGAIGGASFSDWQLDFTGVSTSGIVSYDVAFSTDGTSYNTIASAQTLTTTEALQTFVVAGNPSTTGGYFKLDFAGVTGGSVQPVIDNVSIVAVPEPSTYALLAGFLALGMIICRRLA
ncbi:MAG: PEP-CTERM sorting domain-containing protein [Oceanipulchritudo sp.]